MHFQGAGSLRRERSLALAKYAEVFEIQRAQNGDLLASVGVWPSNVRLLERLVESIGQGSMRSTTGRASGFATGWSRDAIDKSSIWWRMGEDNHLSQRYDWTAQKIALAYGLSLPTDLPEIPGSLPWDPDVRYREILAHTEVGDLKAAVRLVDAIDPDEREILFDEIIYLRYLVGTPPRGSDLLYLASGYIAGSSISARLKLDLATYIALLDDECARGGPLPPRFPGINGSSGGSDEWLQTRAQYFNELSEFGHPTKPRGRIFIWHPDISAASMTWVRNAFKPQLIAAENAYRRANGIPEIGKGWASEVALFSLVKSLYPDAVHQWRPHFLGAQSIDIYIPQIPVAIEYQGKQHYEPVKLFGGEEGFVATCLRDERKRTLLAASGIPLIEWRYDRPTSLTEVELAVREVMQNA